MARTRLDTWLSSPAATKRAPASSFDGIGSLLAAFRTGAPSQWSQNLLELSRHFVGPAFLAINTFATQAGGSTFEVYERTTTADVPNGKVALPWDDPIHQVFEEPNEHDSWHDLMYQAKQQKKMTGISLIWHPRYADNDIAGLYVIPSATAWPMPPNPDYPAGSYRVLPYPMGMYGAPSSTAALTAGAIVPAEQILRIKDHHPYLRHDGYATLTAISLQVDTIEAIDKGRNATQQLGCDQSLAFELDPQASFPDEGDLTRIRAQLQALYSGPKNAGKILITPPGGKINKFSTSPSEMGYQDGWAQIIDFVLASFGVPQAVAGMQKELSYSTLFSSYRAFAFLSLQPDLDKDSAQFNKRLIRPTYGRNYGIAIKAPQLTDEALEEMKWANDMKCGSATIAERRKYRGFDHIDEPWAKERCFQNTPNAAGGKENEPKHPGQEMDPDVDRSRTTEKGHRLDGLWEALERGKTNGTLKQIKV